MVHNATSRRSGDPVRLEDADDALLDEHMAVSLRGTFHCATAALPHLRESAGAFVTMTSPAGMEGSFMLPLYGTVKAALRGFTKSVAREWAPYGIRVNTVSPLAMTPAMTHAYTEDPGPGGPDDEPGPARAHRRPRDRHRPGRRLPPRRRVPLRDRADPRRRRRPVHESVR